MTDAVENNAFARKLAYGAELPQADKAVLVDVSSGGRRMPSRSDIIAEGDRPTNAHLIMEGYGEREGLDPNLPRLTKPFRKDELAACLAELG